jgi:hypothetical protein
MGPSLDPNSTRIEIDALLRPLPSVELDPFARMILHGNASAYFGGTGTIFDPGYHAVSPEPFLTFRFLSQFEYILDAGSVAGATAINNYLGMDVKYSY